MVQTLSKFKNIIGGLAAIFGIAAFSVYYIYAREFNIKLDDLYFFASFITFSTFSGLLFSVFWNKGVGSLYLLSFGFFTFALIASTIEYLNSNILVMAHIYYCLIATFILTIITYTVLWLRHYLQS